MIRDQSRPLPPADSGWKPLPSPEPSVRVQVPEDRTTPRRSATRLPQLEHPSPNASAPSIGCNTPVATSSESSEAVTNPSEDSLPIPAATRKRPISVDSGIDLRVELPTGTLSTLLPSVSPTSLTALAPLPGPDRELLSVLPVRKRARRKSWIQTYVYDYDP
ncbi:hypothetical protein EDB85DRAFT_1942912 [Lactarius pseudohatsudake]|nr:hypothetical protein EDB85DRAFT_1942912 [Lactarius pseudohatsudake]